MFRKALVRKFKYIRFDGETRKSTRSRQAYFIKKPLINRLVSDRHRIDGFGAGLTKKTMIYMSLSDAGGSLKFAFLCALTPSHGNIGWHYYGQ